MAKKSGRKHAPAASLSHVRREAGRTRGRMVDVGKKVPTERVAVARARIRFPTGVLARVLDGAGPKGPIEEAARCAGRRVRLRYAGDRWMARQ